ncbi:MAG: 2-C-methyl-D-erythritol 4-phosphate cytidylyltransferase [Gemmatimonadetes bacterium]|nr:2-C-methyl-D-erythritol 4-phosphate cytidylyltransferase [Gemmatimonadota bacterium]MBK7714184.1 2-C-methyl-D-erythritol 4-phosphate cytidylyltransferase [Gemmatimonadota bacterium]MBP6671354.1 2-C-methyl-D-erythritol 4-phosphate cytidylyltransferase [Gemmatimonadales bacterium]
MPRDVGVVIVAAGQGTRLGAGVPKQYLPLGGVPMLLRALRPFTSHPEVAHTVVVLPAADAAHPPAWLAEVLGDTLSVTAGGAERSDSVACGLAALPAACAVVLVHDAARPFVDQAIISAVAAVARTGEGAVPAIPVGDTLKQVAAGEGGRILRTVPRDGLFRAQTPQGFPRRVLQEAHARAPREGGGATDDALLVEQAGVPVRVVPGSARNFKITTEDDLRIAERLL